MMVGEVLLIAKTIYLFLQVFTAQVERFLILFDPNNLENVCKQYFSIPLQASGRSMQKCFQNSSKRFEVDKLYFHNWRTLQNLITLTECPLMSRNIFP